MTQKTTATTAETTAETTGETRMDTRNHGNHGRPPRMCARAHAHTHTRAHMRTRTCAHLAVVAVVLSDIKDLQHFCRGFCRGFSSAAVVLSKKERKCSI